MVIITKRHAYKFPRMTSWRLFLQGLIANMNEAAFSTLRCSRLCPVTFAVRGGWLVVMPFARPLTDAEWEKNRDGILLGLLREREDGLCFPAEFKQSSFGFWGAEIVAVDYGD